MEDDRNIRDFLGFGKNLNDETQPIGVAGEENNELVTFSLEEINIFRKILKELKKFNLQLEEITGTRLTKKDAVSYKQRL